MERPEKPPVIGNIEIPISQIMSNKWSGGWLHMCMASVDISTGEDDDKTHIGSISMILNGTGLQISFHSGKQEGNTYTIKSQDIWNALCKHLGEDQFIIDQE